MIFCIFYSSANNDFIPYDSMLPLKQTGKRPTKLWERKVYMPEACCGDRGGMARRPRVIDAINKVLLFLKISIQTGVRALVRLSSSVSICKIWLTHDEIPLFKLGEKKIASIDLSFLKICIGKTIRNFESRESECVSTRDERTMAYLSTDPCG